MPYRAEQQAGRPAWKALGGLLRDQKAVKHGPVFGALLFQDRDTGQAGRGGMQGQTSQIQQLLEPVVTGMGYELVGVENLREGGNNLLRVYIDHAPGITVDDCERVSRQIGAVLDVEEAIRGGYTLEVSSPGWDRPLFTQAHFDRFAGSNVRLQLTEPTENRRRFKGRLIGMQADDVLVEVDGTEYRIPFNRIAKARLVAD